MFIPGPDDGAVTPPAPAAQPGGGGDRELDYTPSAVEGDPSDDEGPAGSRPLTESELAQFPQPRVADVQPPGEQDVEPPRREAAELGLATCEFKSRASNYC